MAAVASGQFTFDTETLELSRNGERVELAPKPGKLLKALIAAAPGIVTREEARQLLWPQASSGRKPALPQIPEHLFQV